MDAAPTHIADDHLDLLCAERPLVHAWFEVLFEAEVERAAGIVLQPMAGRPASLESAPESDDIDPVDEAEHDELGEALVADDTEDKVLPEEVDAGRHGGRRRSMRNDENVKGGWFDRQCARQG